MKYVPMRQRALAPQRRWTIARKALVLLALEWKAVTDDEVMAAHAISADEMAEWKARRDWYGAGGLRVTRPLPHADGGDL